IRGHHPAAALAKDLSRRWQLEFVAALERTRVTRRQTGLPLAVRRRNVTGAFAPAGPVARNIAIADDVYTTGATASAAASALRQVVVLPVARHVLHVRRRGRSDRLVRHRVAAAASGPVGIAGIRVRAVVLDEHGVPPHARRLLREERQERVSVDGRRYRGPGD